MAKRTKLDDQWQHLMTLCRSEAAHRASGRHPKLLKLISADIEELARTMGFSDQQIRTREFRAERDGDRIVRIVTR